MLLDTTAEPDLWGGLFVSGMGVVILLLPVRIMLRIDQRLGQFLLHVLGQKGIVIFYKLLGIGLIVLGVSLLV